LKYFQPQSLLAPISIIPAYFSLSPFENQSLSKFTIGVSQLLLQLDIMCLSLASYVAATFDSCDSAQTKRYNLEDRIMEMVAFRGDISSFSNVSAYNSIFKGVWRRI